MLIKISVFRICCSCYSNYPTFLDRTVFVRISNSSRDKQCSLFFFNSGQILTPLLAQVARFFFLAQLPSPTALSGGRNTITCNFSHRSLASGGWIRSIGAMCLRHRAASDAPDAILVKAVCPCWQVGEFCMRTCRNQARAGYVSCS